MPERRCSTLVEKSCAMNSPVACCAPAPEPSSVTKNGLGQALEAGILTTELIQRARTAHFGGRVEEYVDPVPKRVLVALFNSFGTARFGWLAGGAQQYSK